MGTIATPARDRRARRPAADELARLFRERARFVAELAGNAMVAAWLGVPRGRLAQWCDGTERPGIPHAQMLIDFDYAIARALLLWQPRVAVDWLTSSNICLDGARPVDAIRLGRLTDVTNALDIVDTAMA